MPAAFMEELFAVSELDGTDLIVPDEEAQRLTDKYQAAHSEAMQGGKVEPRFKGAGDVVAFIAQPIARGLDMIFGTDLENCGGCKERREALNEALPFSKTVIVDNPKE